MNENAGIHRPGPEDGAEYRGLGTDIAIGAGPAVGAATAWALNHFGGDGNAPTEEQPPKKIALPPGAKTE
jgi:hypothetical protein